MLYIVKDRKGPRDPGLLWGINPRSPVLLCHLCLGNQSCWKIRDSNNKTSSPDRGGQYPLSPTERHSFPCLDCHLDSGTNHALALLLILHTDATITASTSSKACDSVHSLLKYE